MKPILTCLLWLCLAFAATAQNITVTLTFTPAQAATLSNAAAEANLTATNTYAILLEERLAENDRLRAKGSPTNALPALPLVLDLDSYVKGFALQALTTTQPRLDFEIVDEVRRRVGKLTPAELKEFRRTLPNRR